MIKDTINRTPKVSVIIPLYNKAPYVTKALDSVAAQTCTDYECIIVNDGSTDNSANIVDQWINENSSRCGGRFRLLTKSNSGVAATRNYGVEQSTGEFIAFLDADDWWAPTFLEEMVQLAAQYPDAGLWASNYIYYKPGKTRVGVNKVSTGYINYPKAYYNNGGQVVWTGATMMPRSVFTAVGGFPLGIRLGEDFLLWAKIALAYPVAFLDRPLAYYNNDVPASLRATHNLHAPEHHMLWHLDSLTPLIPLSCSEGEDWCLLLSKLRVSGLQEYWLSDSYHTAAAEELKKVDWEKLPKAEARFYEQPIGYLRIRRRLLQIGAYCKQCIITVFLRRGGC